MRVPRVFQFGVLLFILFTGALPKILQAVLFGLAGGGGMAFVAALMTGLMYDLLRVAPLVVLARHPAGVLHPVIIAVVVWPLLTELPAIIDNFGGYGGLVAGDPLGPPWFVALAWRGAEGMWLDVARFNGLSILALLSVYAGFAFSHRRTGTSGAWMSAVDTHRLRNLLVGIILANLAGVAIFIQLRGGLIEHIADLAFGRFRALAGLGPLLALFDSGFLCLLLWISFRPQDARNPLFLVLVPVVAAQEFVVAGSRAAALMVFVLVGLAWALAARRAPWRLALMILPIAFLSFGVLNIVRTSGLSNRTAVEAVREADLATVIERSQREFDQRQALSGAVPVVADAMRTTGPMWGYTYIGAAAAMIPRQLWPEKPRGPGSIYAQRFLGETVEGAAVPIGGVAEAFWNFHLPGVVVIFALYGWLLRKVHELYDQNPGNGLMVTFFVIFATQFGPATDQLVAFQQMMLTLAIVLVIVFALYPAALRAQPRLPGQAGGPPLRPRAG